MSPRLTTSIGASESSAVRPSVRLPVVMHSSTGSSAATAVWMKISPANRKTETDNQLEKTRQRPLDFGYSMPYPLVKSVSFPADDASTALFSEKILANA